jgi:hypothetical protein
MHLINFLLEEVRLSQNPLTDSGNGVAPHYMLIAHLGKITSLNGSQVKPKEKRDAEIRSVHQPIYHSFAFPS